MEEWTRERAFGAGRDDTERPSRHPKPVQDDADAQEGSTTPHALPDAAKHPE